MNLVVKERILGNKQNDLHFIFPQLFQSYDTLTKSFQNAVHLHARTHALSGYFSILVDCRVIIIQEIG